TRDTTAAIRAAGFEIDDLERGFHSSSLLTITSAPYIIGTARRLGSVVVRDEISDPAVCAGGPAGDVNAVHRVETAGVERRPGAPGVQADVASGWPDSDGGALVQPA